VHFLLQALGESAKVVAADPRNTEFLIDTLKSLTARYELSFTGDDTSAAELQDYLGFAKELGLDKKGATPATLDLLLPRAGNGGFGHVEASYDVRFGDKAIAALLTVKKLPKPTELAVRNAMRQMVLSNYLKSDALHDVAFAYATAGVFDIFAAEGPSEFTNHFHREFLVRLQNPSIAAPARVALDKTELEHLKTLYMIEISMVDAIKDLFSVLGGEQIHPRDFEKKLSKFGNALKDFDSFDQTTNEHGVGTNTIFAMFDLLVRLQDGGDTANVSVLHLKSKANGKDVEKLFLSDAAAEVE
jgi:hypothetical protein